MAVHNFWAHVLIERIEHVPIFKKYEGPFWSPPSHPKCLNNKSINSNKLDLALKISITCVPKVGAP